jgi:hypothetical protein
MTKLTFLEQQQLCKQHPDTRYEFKYVLRPALAKRIENFLAPQLEMDPYCRAEPLHQYSVKSIYWDSPGFECFHNKIGGQRFREKFRLRVYGQADSSPIFLELKQKSNTDYVKRKVVINKAQLHAISAQDASILSEFSEPDRKAIERFYYHLYRKAYRPTSLVVYDRLAYSDTIDNSIRITFDRNLRSRLFPILEEIHYDDRLENLLGDWVIFEVKFSQLVPRWMGTLHRIFHLKPQACSKYCNSVARFLGEVPDMAKGIQHF